ncbi:ATP-binding protein [Streptomyces sp. NPDC090306]|uniref:ATP-binding protein n=1 Tax=Streptomyces sp. NPDC090306 TaxID=3365961 RepID=UPI003806674C
MAHPVAARSRPSPAGLVWPAVGVALIAGAGAALVLAAPRQGRLLLAGVAVVAGVCVLLLGASLSRARRLLRDRSEARAAELAQARAEMSYLVNAVLPRLASGEDDGATGGDPAGHPWQPSDPGLSTVVNALSGTLHAARRRTAAAEAERDAAVAELNGVTDDLRLLVARTVPGSVRRLREGASLDTLRKEQDREVPFGESVRPVADVVVRELAISERRFAAAQAASVKALGRVQAKAVSMLADLREMQDRHDESVLGDLLRLDHNTSQLGLLTDRLALLLGGRTSRSWNKPIPMESILRGAVGRIAAYRRVTLNCASDATIAGYAAEGVMHLLAEVMDNAANFSAPIDQVHVYVEERAAGIVVTVEDGGLKMADAAMRRAEEAVSGSASDLATLQGTRLGLAVVGRLALKYGIAVSFRPSSRGGTGVVVLVPTQLLSQQRTPPGVRQGRRTGAQGNAGGTGAGTPHPAPATRGADASRPPGQAAGDTGSVPAAGAGPAPRSGIAPPRRPQDAGGVPPYPPRDNGDNSTTPGGLPVRAPGRTMAAVDHTRTVADRPADTRPRRSAGDSFGAFHSARRAAAGGDATGAHARPAPPPEPAAAEPTAPDGSGAEAGAAGPAGATDPTSAD